MIHVQSITKTCDACPAQWEGETDAHERIYIRYRHGHLRVELDDRVIIRKFIGKDQNDEEVLAWYRQSGMSEDLFQKMETSFQNMRKFYEGHPICFDGSMSYDELKEITKDEIRWPESAENINHD